VAAREQGLKVEVPKPDKDRPELGRVGVIAAAGFVIGVAWPWLAGVKMVPSPPVDEPNEPAVAPSAAPSGGAPKAAPPLAATEPAPPLVTSEQTVKVGESQITGCRDGKSKVKECDRIAVDAALKGPLAALAGCPAAKGAKETLSIGFELDFESKRVTDVFAGKSTTFSKERTRSLLECARKEVETVRLDGIDHEHERYTAFFFAEFVPPGTTLAAPAGSAEAEPTAEASGLATVGWDVAVVRDTPEDGQILTRLRYGTRVVVLARRGKWYEVKYDAKGRRGWVHKNAIGM
jgi:hypothetical protein